MRGKPTHKTIMSVVPTPWGSLFAHTMPAHRPVKGIWIHPAVLLGIAKRIDLNFHVEAMLRDRHEVGAEPGEARPAF